MKFSGVNSRTEVKVCGLTRAADAALAAELGARYLGFIFYPKSPRGVSLEDFRRLRPDLPSTERVYVQVRPTAEELRAAAGEGFSFFQLHFSSQEDPQVVEEWAKVVSPERLWLAPKIAPGAAFPVQLQPFADAFLVDTYDKNRFGGSGRTGDWERFRHWAREFPEKRWILAGGLAPENIREAIETTGTAVVDVNSGIEETAGKKNADRMRAFFKAVEELHRQQQV